MDIFTWLLVFYGYFGLITGCTTNGLCTLVCENEHDMKTSAIHGYNFPTCASVEMFIQLDYDEMLRWRDVPKFVDIVRVSIACL